MVKCLSAFAFDNYLVANTSVAAIKTHNQDALNCSDVQALSEAEVKTLMFTYSVTDNE
jgi:hypothetical protein